MSAVVEIKTEDDLERAERELAHCLMDQSFSADRTTTLMAEILAFRCAHRSQLERAYPPGDEGDSTPGERETALDEALDETFPASDPPATTTPHRAE